MLIPGRTSIRLLLIVLFCTTGLSLPTLQAQSTLNFPRLSFETDALTGLAIVNPADTDAVVNFTAYGADGQPIAGVTNPEPVTILAGQQFAKLTSELFGSLPGPETVGWFQATSPTDDLVGFFLFLNLPLPASLFDGADLPISAQELVFMQVRLDSGYSTELNLINPNDSAAELELQLIRGASTLTKSLTLAALGAARLDVQDFFETSPLSKDGYVTVASDVEIAGFEFVNAPTGDLVGLNARSRDEKLSKLFFPQVAVLDPFETSVGVVNNSDQAVILTFSVFKPDGSLYDEQDLQTNPVARSLDPGAILVEDLVALFGFMGPDLLQGWLQVQSSASAITGFLTYSIPGTGSAATVTSDRGGLSEVLFSHIATGEDFFTGVALLNPAQLAANLRILAMTPDGEILGSFGTVLRPGERISKLITELVPESTEQNAGLMFLRSNIPLYTSSIFGSSNILANIPPQISPESFAPDAGIDPVQIIPPVAILLPSQSTTFQAQGITGEITWLVNDIERGNLTVGRINDAGEYTAPSVVPFPRIVTVAAESGLQKGGASVDVLEKENLFTTELQIQSVAYLGSLQKLYTAELAILSASGNQAPSTGPTQIGTDSTIFSIDAPGAPKVTLAEFEDETISKMIAFTASTGDEFLLLAAQDTGEVIRLDPDDGDDVTVVTGLDQPSALVIDPITGNLLIAERTQVTIISKAQLEADLLAATRLPPGPLAARGRSTFAELRWYPPMEAAKGSLSWVCRAKQPESVRTGP